MINLLQKLQTLNFKLNINKNNVNYIDLNYNKQNKMKSQKNTKFISVKVKTLNHSIFEIFANPNQPISAIQGQIQQKTSVPTQAQRLLFRGIYLQTNRTFNYYKINENNIISLIANKIQSQFSQNSSLGRSQVNKIKQVNRQHMKFKKHMYLQQRTGGFRIMQNQSLEVLAQSKHVINGLLQCLNYSYVQESMPFRLDKRKLRVGEWVDVRDMSGQWAQAQVISSYNEYVKIHYNGWPQRMNEWISQISERIMPFRTHTVQAQKSNYLSPFPKYQPAFTKSQNINFQSVIETYVHEISSTIDGFNKLLKDLQLDQTQIQIQNQHSMMMENQNYIQNQKQESLKNMSNIAEYAENIQNNLKDIDEVQLDKKEEFYTPSKQIRANDNLSNKAEDDVVSKCDKDDISNKSFKSKRSQGLVDTQSMKSLIIDQKRRSNKIFFDSTQAQSVKSVKNKNHPIPHYYNQQYITQESDSQVGDQPQGNNINKSVSFRKKQYKRKMKASQIAPLADRLGRLLVDLAPHFAALGYQEQAVNNFNQNLSTFTNQGSLQSKLAKATKVAAQQQQKCNIHYHQSNYCQFQIPVMLTPAQISKLTRLLQEQRHQNNTQL